MRLATWNINGLRARIDFLLLWLRERQPDLVGLQELKLADEQFPHAEIEAEGYQAVTHGQKSWNGVAVLSRTPVEVVQAGLPGQEEFGSRLLTVQQGELTFTTVYCPNGKRVEHEDFPKKLAWYDALGEHLAERHDPASQHMLCGDFNIVPCPIDSWDEKRLVGDIFHTDEERARMRALIGWGFADAYRHLHPDEQAFSWWDYRGGAFHRGQGLRIDFLLTTAKLTDRVRHVEIDRDWRKKKEGLTASDHAPVWADVE